MVVQPNTSYLVIPALSEVEKLRFVLREGWRKRGVKEEDLENDFEHTFRVVAHTLLLPTRRQVNRAKSVLMAFLHDFDEIVLKDEERRGEIRLPLEEDPRLAEIASEFRGADRKRLVERAKKLIAFELVVRNWPHHVREEAMRLYTEYTYATTNEAKLVHQAHVVADLRMGFNYVEGKTRTKKRHYRDINLKSFWRDAQILSDWDDAPVDLVPILEEMRKEEENLRAA